MRRGNINGARHLRFWCLIALLLSLIMIRYAFQIDIPRFVFLLIIGLIVLMGDQSEITAMIIACIPLHESIDFFYALVICTGAYVFKYFRQIHLGTNVILILLIIVWELLHCLRSTFSPVTFLSNIIPFIVLAALMASDAERVDYSFIVRVFAWVVFGASMTLFVRVLYFSGFNIPNAIAGLQRLGSDEHSGIENATVSGGQINPNTLGIVTVLASTGLMQIQRMNYGKKSDLVLMCTNIVLAALGASRTYLVCLALMILLLVFSERGGITKKAKSLAVLALTITFAILLFALLFPSNYEYYISRFMVRDITTGRDTLIMQYHRFIVTNPNVLLFGIGLQDYGDRLIHFFRVGENVPHNSIQEVTIAWGIPGLLLFVALYLSMYHDSFTRNRKMSLLNSIPLIIIIFKGIAGQMLNSPYTMLAFSYAYLSLCTDMTAETERQ